MKLFGCRKSHQSHHSWWNFTIRQKVCNPLWKENSRSFRRYTLVFV